MSPDLPAATPTAGSVLQLAPATGHVFFVGEDERWSLPLIGWAVVVSWVAAPTYETAIEPLVLDNEDSGASTVRDYLRDRTGSRVDWTVELA